MKKNAFISLLAALALMLGANTASASKLSDQDMQMAFGGSLQSHNAVMLSQQEMVETEGEVLAYGAVAGFTVYVGTTAYNSWDGSFSSSFNNFTNNWDTGDAALAAASGAVGGAYSSTLFKSVGYSGFANTWTAPLVVQAPIRSGGASLGFGTFGVHGAASSSFQSQMNNYSASNYINNWSNSYCGSCYNPQW